MNHSLIIAGVFSVGIGSGNVSRYTVKMEVMKYTKNILYLVGFGGLTVASSSSDEMSSLSDFLLLAASLLTYKGYSNFQ